MAAPHSSGSNAASHQKKLANAPKPTLAAYLLLGLVQFYRYAISPMLAPRCRFYPTCSQYALDAIRLHGALKGGWLTLKRLARCHPLSAGGEDPVPPKCGCGSPHKTSQKSHRL